MSKKTIRESRSNDGGACNKDSCVPQAHISNPLRLLLIFIHILERNHMRIHIQE